MITITSANALITNGGDTATTVLIVSVTATTDMTTSDMLPGGALIAIGVLTLTPLLVPATENLPPEAHATDHGNFLGEAVKRDAKAATAAFKEGAHRVGVASNAFAHEIAMAARRGATETRAVFRRQKANRSASRRLSAEL